MTKPGPQQSNKSRLLHAHQHHPRHFKENLFVYPVLSRRSGGISIGINLSPHKGCNFDCLYCQVDRRPDQPKAPVYSTAQMADELRDMIDQVLSGHLFRLEPFDKTPASLQRLNDIALSGDGEPTTEKEFLPTCRQVAQIKSDLNLEHVKIVLITNATLFHKSAVQEGLALLDKHQGQIWAKLDAGSEAFYHFIDKTRIPFQRILDNITQAARQRPVYIQTLFTRIDGQPVDPSEIEAYADRINAISAEGGKITAIQLHTIARPPADPRVSSLKDNELDAIAADIRSRLSLSVPIEIYYGRSE